jgi:hypothetical protein
MIEISDIFIVNNLIDELAHEEAQEAEREEGVLGLALVAQLV